MVQSIRPRISLGQDYQRPHGHLLPRQRRPQQLPRPGGHLPALHPGWRGIQKDSRERVGPLDRSTFNPHILLISIHCILFLRSVVLFRPIHPPHDYCIARVQPPVRLGFHVLHLLILSHCQYLHTLHPTASHILYNLYSITFSIPMIKSI